MTTNRIRALPRARSALIFGLAMAVSGLATADVRTPTVKWSYPTRDDSGLGQATAYDSDGAGADKVMHRDEERWLVFDGRTGDVLTDIPFPSGTGHERLAVADIDGDCEAEIFVTGGRPLDLPPQRSQPASVIGPQP